MARTKTKLSRKKAASRGLTLGARPLPSVRGFLGNKRIVVIVVIFSFVGGFFVYQSQAAGVEWRPGNTSVTTNLKRITKKDGLAYWYSMQPTIPPANTDQGGVLPPYSTIGELVLNDEKQGSGTYCAEVQTAGLAGGGAFFGSKCSATLVTSSKWPLHLRRKDKGRSLCHGKLSGRPSHSYY